MSATPVSTPSFPSPPAYPETQPTQFLSNGAQPFKDNYRGVPIHPVTTPFVPAPCANNSVDVSRVKQEPGCHSSLAFDPTRRTVSLDGPYPFYVKTEHSPMMPNDSESIRRQMSLPVHPDYNFPMNSAESRRSSEPAIPAFKSFPQPQSYPSPETSNPTLNPFVRGPPHTAAPTSLSDPNQDLYYVNLASYHHHQELETRKRRELTKGKQLFVYEM